MNWYIRATKEREYYHGTDSPPFDSYDSSKATKGKPHYNPLGDAMYVTDKPDFAKEFGKHVYPVKIPADAKIKRVSPSGAGSAIRDIIMRAMKRVGIDYWDHSAVENWYEFAGIFQRQLDKASDSPYDAIMELIALIDIHFHDKITEFEKAVSEIATRKFSKFDVVIFVGTNDPNAIFIGSTPTQEILIFNKALQKVFSPNL